MNNKKAKAEPSSEEQHRRNMDELNGWNEWRVRCSIMRVLTPELTKNEQDELSQEDRGLFYSAIKEPIISVFMAQTKPIFKKSMQISEQEIIQEFDTRMWQRKKKILKDFSEFSSRANYKDYIFFKVAQNPDQPPLKIIRGKIYGQGGFLRDIVKEYIRRNYSSEMISLKNDAGQNVRRISFLSSTDKEITTKQGDTINLDILDPKGLNSQDRLMPIDSAQWICSLLDRREKLAFLAKAFGISVDNPELNKAAGVTRSGCALAVLSMRKKLDDNNVQEYAEALNLVISLLITQFKSEKSAESFLLLLKQQSEKE